LGKLPVETTSAVKWPGKLEASFKRELSVKQQPFEALAIALFLVPIDGQQY
jgi:hypothetical protein